MLEVGEEVCGLEEAGEQKDHPGGQESTECDTDVETRAAGKDHKESVVSVPPVKARRDAFI